MDLLYFIQYLSLKFSLQPQCCKIMNTKCTFKFSSHVKQPNSYRVNKLSIKLLTTMPSSGCVDAFLPSLFISYHFYIESITASVCLLRYPRKGGRRKIGMKKDITQECQSPDLIQIYLTSCLTEQHTTEHVQYSYKGTMV